MPENSFSEDDPFLGRTQVKNESAEAQAMEADAPMH